MIATLLIAIALFWTLYLALAIVMTQERREDKNTGMAIMVGVVIIALMLLFGSLMLLFG